MNRRRRLLVAAAALAVPLGARAQQAGRVWRVGFLVPRSKPDHFDEDPLAGFSRGLKKLGYKEGSDIVIEWRFGNNDPERTRALAVELVRAKVDVLVAQASPAVRAAQAATKSIPIVMASVTDPVASGFVKNLARPGGNTTGVANLGEDLSPKHVEFITATAPKVNRIAVLSNPLSPAQATYLKKLASAGRRAGRQVENYDATSPEEIDAAFQRMVQDKAGAVIVVTDTFMFERRRQIVALAEKHRLPLMGPFRHWAEAGSLYSYGHDRNVVYERVASYVDRILKGAKPGELPVEMPMEFELVVNLRTAKAIGVTVPQLILGRADKVIQ